MSEDTKVDTKTNEPDLDLKIDEGKVEDKKVDDKVEGEGEGEGKVESWKDVPALKKFGSSDDLAQAYVELEKKLSGAKKKDLGTLSDEDLVKEMKDYFGELSESGSSLEGHLGEISESVAKQLGVATKLVDVAAATVAKEVVGSRINENKKAASGVLKDPLKKQSIVNAIKAKGGEYATSFQKRLNDGQVGAVELELLQEAGQPLIEADLGIKGEDMSQEALQDAETELFRMQDSEAHIWTQPNHPQYLKTVEKMSRLKKKLGIL